MIFTRYPKKPTTGIYLLTLVIGLVGCAGAPQDDAPGVVAVDIVYATDRGPTGDTKPDRYYGPDRGTLTYGRAEVLLPAYEKAAPGYWQVMAGRVKKSHLEAVRPMEGRSPVAFLQAAANDRPDRSALVFIHGYKKSFSRAARNLAEIAYGADYRGLPVLFSWPSSDATVGYASDTTTLRWSTRNFLETLDTLAEVHDLDTIHLVAHSMGSQAVLHVLENERVPGPGERRWRVGEVVMFAPDVDRDRFLRDAMPKLRQAGIRTTLYMSDLDIPLWSSRVVNKYPRLGDATAGIVVAPGLETVDASEVAGLFTTHIYHLSLPAQRDLGLLLNRRLGAAERTTLEEVEADQGLYWTLRPPEDEDQKEGT